MRSLHYAAITQTQNTVSTVTFYTVSVNIMKKLKLQAMTTYRRHMSSRDKTNFWIKTSLTYFIKFQWFALPVYLDNYLNHECQLL